MTTPQVSIQLRTFRQDDPGSFSYVLDQARAADVAGIDRVAVSDHVAYGENLEAYGDPKKGGSVGGKQPTDSDGNWLEPLTVLTAMGALTERIRLNTAILIAALRTPTVLAKQAATIDVLTGGRLELGVGVEEVAPARPDHHVQFDPRELPDGLDGTQTRGGAAFGGVLAEFDAVGPALLGGQGRGVGIGDDLEEGHGDARRLGQGGGDANPGFGQVTP